MSHRHTALDHLRESEDLCHTTQEQLMYHLSAAWTHAGLEIADAIRETHAIREIRHRRTTGDPTRRAD